MDGVARPPEVSGAHRALATLVTERLRVVLERRSIRWAVVGTMLIAASTYTLFPAPTRSFDPHWVFVLPVAIAAIAAGLREGMWVALISVGLIAVFSSAQSGAALEETDLLTLVTQWFALFGIISAVLGAFAEAHYSVQSSLRQLATTDPLTKVSNIERFYHELSLLQASDTRYVVMILDVDNLKALNDKFGHQAGSAAIQMVANVLRAVLRGSDTIARAGEGGHTIARYGGDEFVLILKEADRVGAQIVANRIRRMLSGERISLAPDVELSVSIGVAVAREDGMTSEELLSFADKAMYEEKRVGKASK